MTPDGVEWAVIGLWVIFCIYDSWASFRDERRWPHA